ncbi:MAG: hypothetical protein FJ138_14560, partial [Deltaproteobacteria bacterium]|nr:hypothetical protein [Deltaproteobacteria bacterium]
RGGGGAQGRGDASPLLPLAAPLAAPRVRQVGGVPLLSIEDPRGALRPFFRRLGETARGERVRVLHYGDSLIAGDYVTRTVRRLLQKRFGFGGQGFLLAGKPSGWYGRAGVRLAASSHWRPDRATRSTTPERSYGVGGVSFRTRAAHATVTAEAEEQAREGLDARVDTFEVHFLAQPGGGRFRVSFGGASQEVSAAAEGLEPRRVTLRAPLGLHTGEVRTLGGGEVRLFGVSLERAGGGVVYDALGLTGSRAKQLLMWDRAHWATQARWLDPDLFVLHYGTNESEDGALNMTTYAGVLRDLIGRLRAASPAAACLLVSPMDRAYRDEASGAIRTRPVIPKIVEAQRAVARAEGCAFWSAYDAMGGAGALKRWYEASPPLAGGDLTHPTGRGANLLGAMLFSALIEAYGGGAP